MARAKKTETFTILAPKFDTVEVLIRGTAPLMVHHFSAKVRKQIEAKQTATDKVTRTRAPKDYVAEFNAARYLSKQGWDGFYAGSIRNAMIAAARYVDGLSMAKAKGLFFIEADGFDKDDGTPLVRIIGAKPVHDTRPARNDGGGIDIRNRPRFDAWSARVRIRFDQEHITAADVLNLLARAGMQVGICEGRPGSKESNGIGFGIFEVLGMPKHAHRDRPAKASKVNRPSSTNGHDRRAPVEIHA